jgi:hypothetical protein
MPISPLYIHSLNGQELAASITELPFWRKKIEERRMRIEDREWRIENGK